MASDGRGWAWGEDGLVLHTQDGGASWQQLDAGTNDTFAGGVLLPDGGVWLAGDGGAVVAGAPVPVASPGAP
jgi:photosystem II stability/assembly factor-like uncharacterized protein